MGVAMEVYSEISGPVDEYKTDLVGHRIVWGWSGDCYLVKQHPEIWDVSWSYGNLVRRWNQIIAQYAGHEAVARIGSQGILFPDEVKAISEYLSAVEPLAEHGESFAGRLKELQQLFGKAAELPGGIVYNS